MQCWGIRADWKPQGGAVCLFGNDRHRASALYRLPKMDERSASWCHLALDIALCLCTGHYLVDSLTDTGDADELSSALQPDSFVNVAKVVLSRRCTILLLFWFDHLKAIDQNRKKGWCHPGCHNIIWCSASPLAACPSISVTPWSYLSSWTWSLPSSEQPSSLMAHLVGSSGLSHTHQSQDIGGHQREQNYRKSCLCTRGDLCPPTTSPLLHGSSLQLMCQVSHPFLHVVCCIYIDTH